MEEEEIQAQTNQKQPQGKQEVAMPNWNMPEGYRIDHAIIWGYETVLVQKNYHASMHTVFYNGASVLKLGHSVAVWRLKSLKTDQHVHTPNTGKV